jgi:hypothetical protein
MDKQPKETWKTICEQNSNMNKDMKIIKKQPNRHSRVKKYKD